MDGMTSETFTTEESSQIYMLFKCIDSENEGFITAETLNEFVKELKAESDDNDFKTSGSISEVPKLVFVELLDSNNERLTFDEFQRAIRQWFLNSSGTVALRSSYGNGVLQPARDSGMAKKQAMGFHQICRSLLSRDTPTLAVSTLLEGFFSLRNVEQFLDLVRSDGEFNGSISFESKIEATNKLNSLLGEFKEISIEITQNLDQNQVGDGLYKITEMLEILNLIRTKYELSFIWDNLKKLFDLIFSFPILDKIVDVLRTDPLSKEIDQLHLVSLQVLSGLAQGMKLFSDQEHLSFNYERSLHTQMQNHLGSDTLINLILQHTDSRCLEVKDQALVTLGFLCHSGIDLRPIVSQLGF